MEKASPLETEIGLIIEVENSTMGTERGTTLVYTLFNNTRNAKRQIDYKSLFRSFDSLESDPPTQSDYLSLLILPNNLFKLF